MRRPYLGAVSASRQCLFFDPALVETQSSSPVFEAIACVFIGVKIKTLAGEPAKVLLRLLNFQSTAKPSGVSLMSGCSDLLFR